MEKIEKDAAVAFLRDHDNYLILTHRRPDGDTIGSACALCRGLRDNGKTAYVLHNTQFTPKYAEFLDGVETETEPENATIVTVDTASPSQFLLGGEEYVSRTVLAIDHHGTNSEYAQKTYVRGDYAACAELIYEILSDMEAPIGVKTAEAIYLGSATDTGCFRYSNTTVHTLQTAADMKAIGADTFHINKVMFSTKTMAKIKLEGHLAQSVELAMDGKIGITEISAALMEQYHATDDDIDDLAGFARQIEGVQIALMLREVENGDTKISVRTDGVIDSAAICANLGGGGHKGAGGATVHATIAETKQRVLASVMQETGWEL